MTKEFKLYKLYDAHSGRTYTLEITCQNTQVPVLIRKLYGHFRGSFAYEDVCGFDDSARTLIPVSCEFSY